MRHPLGTLHHEMKDKNFTHVLGPGCGGHIIDQWLRVHDILAGDIDKLKTVVVVKFEHFMGPDSQAIFNELQSEVGVMPAVKVPKTTHFDNKTYSIFKDSQPRKGRGLLELHGSRTNITVVADSEFLWIETFNRFAAVHKSHCDAMILKYEARVNKYGYSLVTPRKFWKPAPYEDQYIKGFDRSFPPDSVPSP